MQKFHASNPTSCYNFGRGQELGENLFLCRSNLNLKRKQIRLLKEKLKKACIVARTVMTAKENQTISLNNHINSARSECLELQHKNKTYTETIENLERENSILRNKIENYDNFIGLGYQELQKIQNAPAKNIATVIKLKELIVSCGQYYADYCNEHQTCVQVEKKSRDLYNKINILESNLKSIVEDLKIVRHLNSKLQKENTILKNKLIQKIEMTTLTDENKNEIVKKECNRRDNNVDYLNFTSHLKLVKDLLSDQENMLTDLRKLSEQLNNASPLECASQSS